MISSFYLKDNHFVSQNGTFQDFNLQGKIIYEVIRVIDGKVLFFEDHITRFLNSLHKSNMSHVLTNQTIENKINSYIQKINLFNGNIKFLIQSNDQIQTFYAFEISHYYPSDNEYQEGVHTTIYKALRENPNIKLQRSDLKINIESLLAEKMAYEAILLHPDGYITEGSKSNLFLIKNHIVYTAPDKDVLSGITRKKILFLFKENNVSYIESRIPLSEINEYESAFISGTSPKVLPVKSIDQIHFNVNHPLLRKIIQLYNNLIETYLKKI